MNGCTPAATTWRRIRRRCRSLVHINKCPVLAPAKTLLPENAERLGIDRQACLQNLQLLKQHPEVREKVVALFAEAEPFKAPTTSTPGCMTASSATPTRRR